MTLRILRGLIAQAYCTRENAGKVLDPTLIDAIAEILLPKFKKEN